MDELLSVSHGGWLSDEGQRGLAFLWRSRRVDWLTSWHSDKLTIHQDHISGLGQHTAVTDWTLGMAGMAWHIGPILRLHVADSFHVPTSEITRIIRFGENPGFIPGYASMKHHYRILTIVKPQPQKSKTSSIPGISTMMKPKQVWDFEAAGWNSMILGMWHCGCCPIALRLWSWKE